MGNTLTHNQQIELFPALEESTEESHSAPSEHGFSSRLVRDGLSLLVNSRTHFWTAYDATIAILSAYLGFYLSPAYSFGSVGKHADPVVVIPLCGLVFVLACLVFGVYERRSFESRAAALLQISLATVATWGTIIIGYYVLRYEFTGRWITALAGSTCIVGATLPRFLLQGVAARSPRRVLVAGDQRAAQTVKSFVEKTGGNGFKIVGAFQYPSSGRGSTETGFLDPPEYPLAEACRRLGVDVVVVGDGIDCDHDGLQTEIMQCMKHRVQIADMTLFVEESFRKVPVQDIGPDWLLSANLRVNRAFVALTKRGSDIFLGLLGLITTLPVWPLIALLVKLTSRGPVFYKQARVGHFGMPFTILKFRTMRTDAEAKGKAVWARAGDPRVTRVGRFLRKTRLDEIPQFWNILKGDMSFIGPRPERPEFVEELARNMPQYRWRHLVRPGATGWAQINFRYGASEDDAWEKLSYDLYYIKHCSLALDAYICLRTVGALLRGAR